MAKNKDKSQVQGELNQAPEQAAPQTHVGIEVDGSEVHVAYVESTGTVRVEHFRDESSVNALDAALKSIPSRANIVRVAFTGGRQYVRRVEVPRVPERAMRAALVAVAEENLPVVPGAASVAGLVIGSSDVGNEVNTSLNMVIAAVESDDLDPVWRKLGGRTAPITSASFLLPADGLYLRVGRSTAEMIIVRGGVPLLARSLRVGGLDELERRVRASSQAGFGSLTEGNVDSADAGKTDAEITDLYLDELVNDFRKTLVFWKREGTDVPNDIIVLGAGAMIPTLLTRVRDAGFVINSVPEPRGVHLAMADHEKPVAFQALAAAYSDFSQQPYAILPNPVYDAQKLASKRRAKQRRIFLTAAAVIAVIVGLAVVPLGYAKTREALATSNREEAEKNIVQYKELLDKNDQLEDGEAAVKAIETGVPAYTKTICAVMSSSPEVNGTATQFKSLSISTTDAGSAIDTSFTVSDSQPGFQVFGDWKTRIEDSVSAKTTLNSSEIGVGSFKFNPESGTKDGSFRWTAPLFEDFKVPNVSSCDRYVGGLSEYQQKKIEYGYDANDATVKYDPSTGQLLDVASGKEAKRLTATTTTTAPEKSEDADDQGSN